NSGAIAEFFVDDAGRKIIQFMPHLADLDRAVQLRIAMHELGHGRQFEEFFKAGLAGSGWTSRAVAGQRFGEIAKKMGIRYYRMEIETELRALRGLQSSGELIPGVTQDILEKIGEQIDKLVELGAFTLPP